MDHLKQKQSYSRKSGKTSRNSNSYEVNTEYGGRVRYNRHHLNVIPESSDGPPNGATPEQPEFQPDSSISSSAQSASVSPTQPIASRTRLGTGGIIRPPSYLCYPIGN